MPKRSRTKYGGRNEDFAISNLGGAQVFRNSFAVFDGADPQISLQYMKDMFKGKLDEDVITMIFSECAYDVDQALETLISLANDGDNVTNGNKASMHNLNSTDNNKDNYSCEELNQSEEFNMKKLSKHLNSKHYFNSVKDSSNCNKSSFVSSFLEKDKDNLDMTPNSHICNSRGNAVKTNLDSIQSFEGSADYKDYNLFAEYLDTTARHPNLENHKQNSYSYSSSWNGSNHQNNVLEVECKKSITSLGQFKKTYNNPKFVTPLMPMSNRLQLNSTIGYNPFTPAFADHNVRKIHSTSPTQNDNKESLHQKTIIEKIRCGQKILIILRGLPGSGKSTLARQFKFSGVVFSTDDFFYRRGVYVFEGRRLSEAHEWNRDRTEKALERSITPVIIDNTNIVAWEFAPYVHLGLKHGYEVHILEPTTPWKFDSKELALRNKHKVSKESIDRMIEKFEHNVSVETIVESISINNENSNLQKQDIPEQKVAISTLSDDTGSTDEGFKSMQTFLPKNFIKLEAVVHREDNIESCETHDSKCDSTTEGTLEVSSNKSNTNEDNVNSDQKISNLNELRALIQADSEESQSLSRNTSTSDSNQDVSCWEAITEHDDDFLWSTLPTGAPIDNMHPLEFQKISDGSKIELNVKELVHLDSNKDAKHNNLFEMETNLKNTTPIDEGIDNPSPNMHFKDLNQKKLVVKEISNDTIVDEINATNFIKNTFEPKLQVNSSFSEGQIKLSKELFSNNCSSKNNSDNIIANNSVNETDHTLDTWDESWNINEGKNDDSLASNFNEIQNKMTLFNIQPDKTFVDSKEETKADELNLICPKPQRKERGSTILLKKLFDFKPVLSARKTSKEIIWDTNVSSDSWNESETTEISSLENKCSGSSESKQNLTDSDITTETDLVDANINSLQSGEAFKEKKIENFVISSPKIKNSKKPLESFRSLFSNSFGNLSKDWEFPAYLKTEDQDPNESIPGKGNNFGSSIETQTEPHDFVLLHKIESKENCTIDFAVLTSKSKEKCDPTDYVNENIVQKDLYQPACFEKSTSTDDLCCEIEIAQKFLNMHECFPDIAEEDLKHLLEICHGDNNWLSNLLVEWGYKYNVSIEDANPETKAASDFDSLDMKSASFKNLFNNMKDTHHEIIAKDDKQVENLKLNLEDELSESTESYSQNLSSKVKEDNSVSESSNFTVPSIPNSKLFSKLHLSLNPAFALQLEELFGPVGDISNAPVVEISLKHAKKIHKKWKETVQRKSKSSDISKSKDIVTDKDCRKNAADFKFQPFVENEHSLKSDTSQEPLPLSEIMDMEYALELHKKEKIKTDTHFIRKLERQTLYSMFPGADTLALDEIFESNKYSLKHSIVALGEDIQYPESVEKVKKEELKDGKVSGSNKSETGILQDFINNDWSEWVFQEEKDTSEYYTTLQDFNTISPEAAQLREEATMHCNLRQESIQKAQQAYCKGMKDVASYYAQKGNMHGTKFKELNKMASGLIIQQRNMATGNSALDLHGLYIQEAVPTLERFLRDKKLELKKRQLNTLTLSIITGQGIHSERGPKLRPSVMEYLKKTGYRYYEINKGLLQVTLIPDN